MLISMVFIKTQKPVSLTLAYISSLLELLRVDILSLFHFFEIFYV